MRITLTGSKASGKSTIGGQLAGKLGLELVETDSLTEELFADQFGNAYGCREICATYGEPFFRELEHEAVFEALKHDNALICTGGQTMVDSRCRSALVEAGPVVLLLVPFESIWERITQDGFPSYFPAANQKEWFRERVARFRERMVPLSDVVCELDHLPPDEATARVLARVRPLLDVSTSA